MLGARRGRARRPPGSCLDEESLASTTSRYLLSFLPQNSADPAPKDRPADADDRESPDLDPQDPDNPNKPYDIKRVVTTVVDDGDFLELQPLFAPQHRLPGSPGSAASRSASSRNQPHVPRRASSTSTRPWKAARFVRTCDAFNIPIVTFVDVPGFLPGATQEWAGIIRHGAKLLYAYAEAMVLEAGGDHPQGVRRCLRRHEPRSTCGPDFNVAWPTAEIAVMGPEGAVNIIFRSELAEAEDKEARRAELISDSSRAGSRTRTARPSGGTSTT